MAANVEGSGKEDQSVVDDETLMNLVQNYKVIYDKSSKSYKNRNSKKNAWEEIAKKLSMTVDECQRRYTTIRTRFSKYLKQHREAKKTGTGADDMPKIRQDYEYLRWLTVHIKHRVGTSNFTSEQEEIDLGDDGVEKSSQEDMLVDDQGSIHDVRSGSVLTDDTSCTSIDQDDETVKVHVKQKRSSSSDDSISSSSGKIKKKKLKDKLTNAEIDHEFFSTMSRINQAIQSEESTNKSVDDEDRLFCLSLVNQLKRMNPRDKSLVKIEILKAFHEVENNKSLPSDRSYFTTHPVPPHTYLPYYHPPQDYSPINHSHTSTGPTCTSNTD